MCRNIKTLHNFKPPATEEEVRASALQFVRKLSGFARPSKANEAAFNHAVDVVTKAAQEGDPLAIDLLAELGRWIGEGSASVAALLDPALIVIGGGVGAAGDLLLGPARKAFGEQLSARGHRPEAAIVLAAMGNDAGIVGAADLARI